MKTLKAKNPVNKAGGGLVYNKNGEVLFIFRNGKWIYPKEEQKRRRYRGHINARGRGGNGCQSTRIIKTYKNLPRFQAQRCLQTKITHWFEMQSDFEGTLRQLEEGIEK
jgi:hypothetical protein